MQEVQVYLSRMKKACLPGKIKCARNHIVDNLYQYGENTSIHGISYISNAANSIVDKVYWSTFFIGCLLVSLFLIQSSYKDWQSNKVITSLKTVAKPVTDLGFPAVTICAEGLHMNAVEKVLYDDFMEWDKAQAGNNESEVKERFMKYMKEIYLITKNDFNILDVLNTFVAPTEQTASSNFVRENEKACTKTQTRDKRDTSIKGRGNCHHFKR